jgi:hypothetical protein
MMGHMLKCQQYLCTGLMCTTFNARATQNKGLSMKMYIILLSETYLDILGILKDQTCWTLYALWVTCPIQIYEVVKAFWLLKFQL